MKFVDRTCATCRHYDAKTADAGAAANGHPNGRCRLWPTPQPMKYATDRCGQHDTAEKPASQE